MTNQYFDEIAKEEFAFLKSDFGLNLVKIHKNKWGYVLIYLGNVTGVKINYEIKEAYIFITLYKLVAGEFLENPWVIEKDSVIHGYSLDDIINSINPNDLMEPAYKYGDNSQYYDAETGLKQYVEAFSNNLKKYGKDILEGNFNIFNKLDAVVKKRTGCI